MKLFTEIEKTIERGFQRWTGRVFGEAQADELLLVHRAILEDIEGQVQVLARGKRIFPFSLVTVTLASEDAARRSIYQAAFAEGGRLQGEIREALEAVGCEIRRGFSVDVKIVEQGSHTFTVDYANPAEASPAETATPASAGVGRLVIVKGHTAQSEYSLDKRRINIGRLGELTDSEQRMVRRNDIVFEEGADEANATVSRRHAHIRHEAGEYRLCDDESEFGTRIFRDGRPIDVPAGNRRGEKLKPGDEIYFGRACARFEQ